MSTKRMSGSGVLLVMVAAVGMACAAPPADARALQGAPPQGAQSQGAPSHDRGAHDGMSQGATPQDAAVERDVQRIREATSRFKALDSAVAAGYHGHVTVCVDNPPQGAMGYHHQNDALLDDSLEVEKPEMLVYERLPSGEYRLNGVEYIVPFSARPATAAAPTIMGQKLKPAPSLNLWYLHVWVWNENPKGLFADWHPGVKC